MSASDNVEVGSGSDVLRIFQIWFDAESRKNCFQHPAVTLYENTKLTAYFENQVILDLAPYSGDYVGVWSHKALPKIVRAHNRSFSLERLVELCDIGGFDVLGFHHRHVRQNILDDSVKRKFELLFDYLMRRLDVPYRCTTTPRFIVMGNHFVARSRVMNDYCRFLARARDVMENDAVLKAEIEKPAPYRVGSPVTYTFHPFLCEKLISVYLEVNPRLVCRFYKELDRARRVGVGQSGSGASGRK